MTLRSTSLLFSLLLAVACDDGDSASPRADGTVGLDGTVADAGTDQAVLRDTGANPVDMSVDGERPDAAPEPEPRPRHEDLIRGDRFNRLIIELDAVDGTLPDMQIFAGVIAQLGDVLDKPGGIDVIVDDSLESRGADHRWTFEEIDALEEATYNLEVAPNAIKIHVLWVDGRTEQDTDRGALLGQAWSARNIVMYSDNIERVCEMSGNGFPLLGDQICDVAYAAVLLHEVGHVIGLVRNPIEMVEPHEDEDHPHHDIDPECVMYYAYEGSAATSALGDRFLSGDETVPTFDDACLADIVRVRDRP